MSKSHYTAKELAGAPGMPKTIKGVMGRNYSSRPIKNKDGSDSKFREYELTALPTETQIYLRAAHLPAVRQAKTTALALTAKPAPVPVASLPEWQRSCMDARLGLLRIIKAAGSVKPAIKALVKAVDNEELPTHILALVPLANARKGATGERSLSERTLLRWWAQWKKAGFQESALVPDGERQPKPEPAWAAAFLVAWAKPQKPALTDVLADLAKEIPANQLPSYAQATYYLKKCGVIEKNKGRMTGNELSSLKPYRRRLTDHMYPGDAYTADGHCFDGEVAHPYHGRPFRPEVTPVIDIVSRLVVGWSCDLAESGLAVLDALRFACENFAVPVIFYTDNGSGYKNQMMTAPGTGILHRLAITPEYSRPRNPQAHGLSERGHQTILIKAAKQLCTYMGRPMDNDAKRIVYKETRKAIKNGEKSDYLLEWDEFVEHINQAITEYNNRPHSGLPAYRDQITRKRIHYTPAQFWQIGMKRAELELAEDDRPHPAKDLPDLYHPAEERTIDRGYIRMGTTRDGLPKMYFSRDLEERTGEKVQVAYSPADAGKVWVRELGSGRLLAVAELGGNASQYFAESKLEEGRYKRGMGRLKRLENHAEEARLEMHGPTHKIIQAEPTAEMKAIKARIIAADEAAAAEVVIPANVITLPLPEPKQQRKPLDVPADERDRYQLWLTLELMMEDGIELQEDEQQFYEGFKRTAIWKAYKRLGK